jgi:hypothetical protein
VREILESRPALNLEWTPEQSLSYVIAPDSWLHEFGAPSRRT